MSETDGFTEADIQRVANVIAQSVNETPSAEHLRLTIMILAGVNEIWSIMNERLAQERD